MLRNTDRSWGVPARLLHWLIAALVFVEIGLGWAAVRWRLSPTKLDLFVLHKSTGLLILALMLVRVAWRLANPAPAMPPGTTALEGFAARATHVLLYVLLILMPVTGWILSSAANVPFRIFWLLPLPAIVQADEALAHAAALVHFALFVALATLLLLHVAAALRHHFVAHDDVLSRMLHGTGRSR